MKKSKKRKSEVNEEEPAWVEVLTDLLLFMLGQEKSSLRNLCNVVWKLLIPHLTENAIKSVLDVLHFTSEDGKVYVLPDKKKDGNVGEEEEESSEDDEEDLADEEIDEDEDAGGNDALIKLKLDLQKALGDNAALMDQESIDLDEVSDDVMQEMGSALGMAFKAHIATKPNKKPTKAEAKNTLARLHFKIR
ncbi:myb-binding protein 1A-like protein [Artemia franciscana]